MNSSSKQDEGYVVPTPHDYELTLTFRVTQYGSPVDPDLAVSVNRILHDWEEGRYPFSVEMLHEGLRQCIKNALYQCCQKRAKEMPDAKEMVQIAQGHRRSRWHIEAEREFDELWKAGEYPGFCNPPNIKIERVNNGSQ